MTAHAETLTPQRPERFAADELKAAALWVNARCADASPALLIDTFRALDSILAKSRGVVALRNLLPGSGLEVLYLPPERGASAELTSLPGAIHQAALTAGLARDLLKVAIEIVEPLRRFGAYAAPIDAPGDEIADLLHYLGRDPAWTA